MKRILLLVETLSGYIAQLSVCSEDPYESVSRICEKYSADLNNPGDFVDMFLSSRDADIRGFICGEIVEKSVVIQVIDKDSGVYVFESSLDGPWDSKTLSVVRKDIFKKTGIPDAPQY